MPRSITLACIAVAALWLGPAAAGATYSRDLGRFATADVSPVDVARDSAGNWYVMDQALECIKVYRQDLTSVVRTIFTCGVEGDDATHITRAHGIGINQVTNVIWVADTGNGRLIKMDRYGNVLRTTRASEAPGGPLERVWDVAVDDRGNAYAIDVKNRVVKVSRRGAFLRQWGSPGSGPGELSLPQSITWSKVGGSTLYVSDARNHRIAMFGPRGGFKGTLGSEGTGDGQFTRDARGIAVGPHGTVYASDVGGNRIVRFSARGKPLASIGAGLPYYRDGADELFYGSRGLFVDGSVIAVADMWNYRVLFWRLDGTPVGEIGGASPPLDGHVEPRGVAVDDDGNVYVSDYWHQWVQKFGPDGTLSARWGIGRGSEPGTLNFPGGIAVDNARAYLYIANREQHVVDRWNLADGSFSARLVPARRPGTLPAWPRDVAVDEATGRIYVADTSNGRFIVLSESGETVATVSTYGEPAQPLGMPTSVSVDEGGNVYVGDWKHSLVDVYDTDGNWIRSFPTAERPTGLDVAGGVVRILGWRIGEYATDGTPIRHWGSRGRDAADQFEKPYVGIAADGDGNVYIGDSKNHRVKVFAP